MSKSNGPLDRLKHHVTGAIERGEKEAIVSQTNVKHTPGPWSVSMRREQTSVIAMNDLGNDVPVAVMIGDSREGYNEQANARLIAAAPELLEALSYLVETYPGIFTSGGIERAKQVINKATGGTK